MFFMGLNAYQFISVLIMVARIVVLVVPPYMTVQAIRRHRDKRAAASIARRKEWRADRLLREHRETEELRQLRRQTADAEWEAILAVFTEHDQAA